MPIVPFYEAARLRRKRLDIAGQPIMVWDAETLTVFKMMFSAARTWLTFEQISPHTGGAIRPALGLGTTRRYVWWRRPAALGLGRTGKRSGGRKLTNRTGSAPFSRLLHTCCANAVRSRI